MDTLSKDISTGYWCINLDRRPDRWEAVQQQFARIGLADKVKRFPAIDGQKLERIPGLSPGNHGLALSHCAIIKRARDEKLDMVFIYEDDVVFVDGYWGKYQTYPENFHMLYFGGNHTHDKPECETSGPEPLNRQPRIWHRVYNTYTSHAMVLTSHVYEDAIRILSKPTKPVDLHYTDLQKHYRAFCAIPALAWQAPGYSDIEEREVDYGNVII